MLLIAIAFTTTLLAAIAAITWFAMWFIWPRIAHARKMQDPMAKASAEYHLMQQAISLEAQQNQLVKQRTEIGLLHLRTVHKDEALFDATQQLLHQNLITVSGQPLLQAPDTMTQLPDLMTQLDGCDSILIVAKKGAGKSNLLRRIIDKRSGVSVLDPHASPNQWGAHQVVGAGLEFDAINTMLHETTEAERRNRYKQLGQGVTQFPERTFCFDEMTEVTSEIDVAKPVQRLLNCRKVNMKVVMGGHSMNAKDLGLDGKFNLLKNFDAVVKIDYNKATQERHYWLCLQPQGHHDDFVECANPGLYVPTVVPAPVPMAVPAPVPTAVQADNQANDGQSTDNNENVVSDTGDNGTIAGQPVDLWLGLPLEKKIYWLLRHAVLIEKRTMNQAGRGYIRDEFTKRGVKLEGNDIITPIIAAQKSVLSEELANKRGQQS